MGFPAAGKICLLARSTSTLLGVLAAGVDGLVGATNGGVDRGGVATGAVAEGSSIVLEGREGLTWISFPEKGRTMSGTGSAA